MKYFILIGVLVLAACGVIPDKEDAQVYKGHPIVGTWVHSINGCDEKFEFTNTGIRIVHSNLEIVKARYDISSISSDDGIYLLKDTVIEDNGKPDCSGSTNDMTGDVVEVYLFIEDSPERFSFCFNQQLGNCVGPYIRKQ